MKSSMLFIMPQCNVATFLDSFHFEKLLWQYPCILWHVLIFFNYIIYKYTNFNQRFYVHVVRGNTERRHSITNDSSFNLKFLLTYMRGLFIKIKFDEKTTTHNHRNRTEANRHRLHKTRKYSTISYSSLSKAMSLAYITRCRSIFYYS